MSNNCISYHFMIGGCHLCWCTPGPPSSRQYEAKLRVTMLVSRALCVRLVRLASIGLGLAALLLSVQLDSTSSTGNKVVRVAAKLVENKTDLKEVGNETETDEWKEDKNEKIMDAKVMRKGDKKLIVVEMPNPKARWGRPLE